MNFDALAAAWAPRLLSILRIMAGLAADAARHRQAPEVSVRAKVWPSSPRCRCRASPAILELVGGVLLVIGLFTRTTAFILSGMTAVAYFIAHAPRGFYPILNGGELAALYCFAFLYLAAAGPGPWSLDAALRKK